MHEGTLRTQRLILSSYIDDISPMVITSITLAYYKQMVRFVKKTLHDSAKEAHLSLDEHKASSVRFGTRQSTKHLGIDINSMGTWKTHINNRSQKAKTVIDTMWRLCSSQGGILSRAARSIYTGMIRPIIIWGAELWNCPNGRTNTLLYKAERIQYRALRRISGAYNGASTEKLLGITAIEPLQAKLIDISNACAARAVRTGDWQIRQFLKAVPTKDPWYCNNPIEDQEGGDGLDSPILAYCSLLEADKEDELNFRDREDTDKVHIDHLTILTPENPNSKSKLP